MLNLLNNIAYFLSNIVESILNSPYMDALNTISTSCIVIFICMLVVVLFLLLIVMTIDIISGIIQRRK